MRAAEGAIERVEIATHSLKPRFRLVGSTVWSDVEEPAPEPARGICGSGIIDAVAELYRTGLVHADGLFTDRRAPNLQTSASGTQYLLADETQTKLDQAIFVTQEDIRQIQLAKAPLYVAAQYLLDALGLERPDRILLAGGFGSYIDPVKAMLLGMIPDCPLEQVHAVGNAAGDGARIALLNRDKRTEAKILQQRVERVELPAQPGFQDQFMLALNFPHMVDPYPHLEGIAPPRTSDPLAQRLFGDELPRISGEPLA